MMPPQPNNAAPRTFSALHRGRRPRSLISLTPLIDVVFILLLFFMLASSFLDLNSIVLDAPTQGAAPSIQGAMLIEVRVDGVRYAGRYISLDELAERVKQQVAEHPGRRILVQPGAGVTLQRTVRVVDRLSSVGASSISFMQSPGSSGLQ